MMENNAVSHTYFFSYATRQISPRKKLVLSRLIIPEIFDASSIPGVSVCLCAHCYPSVNINYYVYIIGTNHFCVQW